MKHEVATLKQHDHIFAVGATIVLIADTLCHEATVAKVVTKNQH